MGIKVKIRGGTVRGDGSSLCETCRYATIVRGESLKQEIIECQNLHGAGRVTFRVTSCTGYKNRSDPSLRDMEEMAWILRTDKSKRIGFVPSKELESKERFVLYDPDDD